MTPCQINIEDELTRGEIDLLIMSVARQQQLIINCRYVFPPWNEIAKLLMHDADEMADWLVTAVIFMKTLIHKVAFAELDDVVAFSLVWT